MSSLNGVNSNTPPVEPNGSTEEEVSELVSSTFSTPAPALDLEFFEEFYRAFFPNNSIEMFNEDLEIFLEKELSSDPNLTGDKLLEKWMEALISGTLNVGPTNLDAAGFAKVKVLDSVVKSLTQTIAELQNLTLAQAANLEFYASYQKAYTDLMNQIPTFIPGDGSPVGGNSLEAADVRLNITNLNNQYVSTLQSYRSNVAASGQKFLAISGQSTQQVNSATNIATAILQTIAQIIQNLSKKRIK